MSPCQSPPSPSNARSLPMPLRWFGPHKLSPGQLFYESKLSYGVVNLKPIVPGHVLLIPKRVVARFADMTPAEVCRGPARPRAIQLHPPHPPVCKGGGEGSETAVSCPPTAVDSLAPKKFLSTKIGRFFSHQIYGK